MTRITVVLTLLAGTVFSGPGWAQDPYLPSPYGAEVQVRIRGLEPLTGELIAVSEDSLWLLDVEALHVLPLQRIEVRLRRFRPGANAAWVWGILGGLATGVGMAGACHSIAGDSDCASVFPAMLLSWVGWSGLGAATLSSSSTTTIPHFSESLRPYARFPQGLPLGVDEVALRPPRYEATPP